MSNIKTHKKHIKNLEHLKLLNLSTYEVVIYDYLHNLKDDKSLSLPATPLQISKDTLIPRASVYETLESLETRGLVINRKLNHKSVWQIQNVEILNEKLQKLKNVISGHSIDRQEIGHSEINNQSSVILHHGLEAVRSIIFKMMRDHKDESFYGYTGATDVIAAWDTVFSREEVNGLNRILKESNVICVGVFPRSFAREAFNQYGVAWAKDYEGRTASTTYIDKKYFTNAGQMFAFRDAMYLIALKDKMVIEIRHSDIQNMILSMYEYMRDTSEKVDINAELRALIRDNSNN